MKSMKRILLVILAVSLLLALASCGGTGDQAAGTSGGKAKSYTWGGASFTVKGIRVVEGDEGSTEGKKIAVTIDLGKDQLAQSVLKKNVSAGKLLLAGKKPSNYDFHIGSQVFGASGLEVKITGETVLYFDMDADYEINEADLVIEE